MLLPLSQEAFIKELRMSETEAKATEKKCEAHMDNLREELAQISMKREEAQSKMRVR